MNGFGNGTVAHLSDLGVVLRSVPPCIGLTATASGCSGTTASERSPVDGVSCLKRLNAFDGHASTPITVFVDLAAGFLVTITSIGLAATCESSVELIAAAIFSTLVMKKLVLS